MNWYEIPLHPASGFGTPLKGDTLFGHFCWQVIHDDTLLNSGDLGKTLLNYKEKPFAVFSSAFLKLNGQYILKKPDLPGFMFPTPPEKECREQQRRIKDWKKKKWAALPSLDGFDLSRLTENDFWTDKTLSCHIAKTKNGTEAGKESIERTQFFRTMNQAHNTINRRTNTTGTDMFAPYVMQNFFYHPGTELAVIVLIDPAVTDAARLKLGLERIGKWGFGRDASTGMGRFKVGDPVPMTPPAFDEADAVYTLAPCVPGKECNGDSWFTPFVRFGRHGDCRATSRYPFKAPVIMADEGAVFPIENSSATGKGYIGQAVEGVSKHTGTVTQGYAPVLPLRLGGK